MRILIVEDDREVAGNIAKMLRESGHVVDMAHDGESYYAGLIQKESIQKELHRGFKPISHRFDSPSIWQTPK